MSGEGGVIPNSMKPKAKQQEDSTAEAKMWLGLWKLNLEFSLLGRNRRRNPPGFAGEEMLVPTEICSHGDVL